MKRNRKNSPHSKRKHRNQPNRRSHLLAYESLEARQLLTVGTGFNTIGANLADPGINSLTPNAEGDVGPNHFVEVGEQTFTVYARSGAVVESSSLNQFFLDAGADLVGEDLLNPRIVYDRAAQRWFAVANGDGNGNFAANWLHVAISDTSDPSGQWKQVQFAADITGVNVHDNVTLGVDADGVYLATQNFDNGIFQNVSVYSLPKADLFLANPTLNRLTRFDNLNALQYGVSIQFANNFEASDGRVFGFSTAVVAGAGPLPQVNPAALNSFQITGANAANATITSPVTVVVDAGTAESTFVPPLRILQPTLDGSPAVELMQPAGLTSSLIEVNGSVFGAQTISFADTLFNDYLTNGINWFQLNVAPGLNPTLAMSPLRGPVSHVFTNGDFNTTDENGDMLPESGSVTYFNPSIAVSDSGLVVLTFNGTTILDAITFNGVMTTDFGQLDANGLPVDPNAIRVSTFAAVGLMVNGAQTGTDMTGAPIFGRNSIQLEAPVIVRQSFADDVYSQPGPFNFWGAYASVRPDPANPNAFFAVIPFQDEVSDEWAVAVTEILPIELRPVIEARPQADVIVVSLDANDTDFVQIEINGVITDRFERSLISQISILGFGGADRFVIDHANGDPTPVDGFTFNGGAGTDTLETLTTEETVFRVDSFVVQNINYPAYLRPFLEATDMGGLADAIPAQDGTFTYVTQAGIDLPADQQLSSRFIDFETLVGGLGNDTFIFVTGPLGGNAEGGAGDDRFVFSGGAGIDGSINGGTGFNTLDLQERIADTSIELFSVGQNSGFNGRTLDGPIGQFSQVLDQFRDISLIRGSQTNATDSFQALNQSAATFTLQIPDIDPNDVPNPNDADSFVASTYQAAGRLLYFTDFEGVFGSVVDDVFNVLSNDAVALPLVRLNGRAGDDTFNFSSDAPTNMGVLSDIAGLFDVNGGVGNNSLVVSDFGRLGPADYLVLSARISGPVEVIYSAVNAGTMQQGTMDVTIIGSDGVAPDNFILQSFLSTNTLNVFGMGGDDTFLIQDLSQATVELFGGEGDDEYIIELVNGIDNRDVTIIDSIGAENDRAIRAGTILNETFVVDIDSFVSDQFTFIGIEEFGFDGRGGNDQFYVRAISVDFPIILRGGDGNDIFHLASDAPVNLGNLSTFNNNLTIDGGTGINRIIASNESGGALDVEIRSSQITGLFNGVLNYTSTGGVFGLVDGNGNVDNQNFGGVTITGSNSGDDSFLIAGFLQQNSLVINGRLGADEFIVGGTPGESVDGVVVVDGGSDGDTYTFFLTNIASQNVIIAESGFSGIDTIAIQGTASGDTISLTEFGILSGSLSIGIDDTIERIEISGNGGDDTISISNAPAGIVFLSGNDGNDQITVTGTVGVTDLQLFGGLGNDQFFITESSTVTIVQANGSDGIDLFDIGAAAFGNVTARGQMGADQYLVDFVDGGSRIVTIVDGGMDAGIDVAMLFGNIGANAFNINNVSVSLGNESVNFGTMLESLEVLGGGGNDIFNLTQSLMTITLSGQMGNDVFNLSSAAPSSSGNTSGISGVVNIAGGVGSNRLNISNPDGPASNVTITSTTIAGLTGGVINYSSVNGQFARTDNAIGGIHIIGSNSGGDVFSIQSVELGDTIRIEGLGGNDTFNINNGIAGDALFDGGNGSDIYNYQFGATSTRDIVISDSGTTGTGTDTLSLTGSNGNDQITIAPDAISDGDSTLTFNVPLTAIVIFGLDGNDTFIVSGSSAVAITLHGNGGNDSFIVNNTAGIDDINLFGGVGNDNFQFDGSVDPTRIDALGSVGNDSFTVGTAAFGPLFLDGESGSDIYTVFFAGQGSRRISTKDTGTDGSDQTRVIGTAGEDRIAIRTTRFLYDDELVIFDENTERVSVESGLGIDRIVVFGSRSALTEVFAGAGDDNFVINGGSAADVINLNGGDGKDTFLVRKTTVNTTTNLFGNAGNDRFNVGSTANQDDGNLGLIRGELNIFGGANDAGQEDQLTVNDNGIDVAYSYSVTGNRIAPIPGPSGLDRSFFVGINYGSDTEFVRLDGTSRANLFQVLASQTTRIYIDGNAPTNAVGDRLDVTFQANDGRQLFITNASQGNGFVSFTNGNEMIQFVSIETPTINSGPANFVFPEGFDPTDFGPDVRFAESTPIGVLAGSEPDGEGETSLQKFDDFFSTADLNDWSEIDEAII